MDNKQRQINGWLLGYAKKYWLQIVGITILSLLVIGLQLLNPWPLKILIDSVFGNVAAPFFLEPMAPRQLLVALAGILIVIYLLQNVFSVLSAYVSSRLNLRFDIDVKSAAFERVMSMSLASFSKKEMGDYLFRINNETGSVRSLVLGVSKTLLESALMIVGILVVLVMLNWQLALLAVAAVPFLYFSVHHFAPKIEQISSQIQVNAAKIYSHTANSIKNIQTVQAFDQLRRQSSLLKRLLQERYEVGLKNLLLHGKFGLANDMISTVVMAGLVLLGGLFVLDESLTLGELIVFLTYVSFLFGPLEAINSSIGKARSDMASIKRVYEVVNIDNSVKEPADPVHIDRVKGFVNFNNVSFAYRYDQPILHGVHITVKAGQKVLFMGPSGSGKSTLLNLLPRFYDPTQGVVHIDGREIRALSLKDLRRLFSIVSQDPLLIDGSIAENIAFGESDRELSSDAIEIRAAAEAADAHHFIKNLPNQYDTIIGPSGVRLSGGQKQRIAIARAFLKNAPILLLDEPTSALDGASERAIVKTLRKLMANRTVLIATHREALIDEADIVYLVKDGEIKKLDDPRGYYRQELADEGPKDDSLFYDSYKDM